jgi:GT2 family glycosyltransferase
VNAAAWFIPLSTLKKVGGFDPIFPHYTEDIDYINRCNFHELSIAICPNSIIWHDTKAYNWNDVKYNLQIRLNFQILELKKLNHSFTGALLLTFKRNFDENITHLLFRKWKDLLFNLKVQFLALKEIKKIYRSRKITKKYSAYL